MSMQVLPLEALLGGGQPQLEPKYANHVLTYGNPAEFRLTFGVTGPHNIRPVNHTTIIMSPMIAKILSQIMVEDIQKWEAENGYITLPDEAEGLTRLFFGVGGADEHKDSGQGPEDNPDKDKDS